MTALGAEKFFHPGDRRCQKWHVGRVFDHDLVVEHDPVRVVHDLGIEELLEGLEEHLIVEQSVDLAKPWWQAQEIGRKDCLPQGL